MPDEEELMYARYHEMVADVKAARDAHDLLQKQIVAEEEVAAKAASALAEKHKKLAELNKRVQELDNAAEQYRIAVTFR